MYDELVKRLRDWPRICVQYDGSTDQLHDEAADAIEELNVVMRAQKAVLDKFPRWIPVTERLPEEHVFVLIRQDKDRMMIAEMVDGAWWYRYFVYDVDRWDENEQGIITHWMPLPLPPKEE